jgi:acyl-CoA thioesterase-1
MVKRRRYIFIVAACLVCGLLGACGRNAAAPTKEERSQAPDSSAAQTQASPPDNRPVIVTFGDSLTAGVAGRSYPDDLQDLLDQHGLKFRVDNQGVSGDTSTDGLARIDNVIAERPALVILEFGGNDGLRGTPIEATHKNLEEMIQRLKDAKLAIVLLGITLPPNYGADYVKPFRAMYPALAQQYRLNYMPFLLEHVYNVPGMMQPDGIHPSGAGNEIVARDVFTLIQPLLTARR